jgi:uncharacterized membrane protein YgcG
MRYKCKKGHVFFCSRSITPKCPHCDEIVHQSSTNTYVENKQDDSFIVIAEDTIEAFEESSSSSNDSSLESGGGDFGGGGSSGEW